MIKRVLINIRQLQFRYTGVQSYIFNLTKNLIIGNPHISFDLATFNYRGDNQFIEQLLSYKNSRLVNTDGFSGLFSEIAFDHISINKAISDQDVYFNPVNIVPLFKKKNVMYVVGVLDLCTFIVPKTTTVSLKIYYHLFLPSSLRRAETIIAISESTKTDLHKIFGIDRSKIKVAYLGVDSKIGKISKKQDRRNKGEYFLMMATSKRKNITNILAAFSMFSKLHIKVQAKIIVNSNLMSDEINRAMEIFSINPRNIKIFTKYTPKVELTRLYRDAICFVYCPEYEGFGLPVLEAMKCGCMVIASNNSSFPEVVKKSGILVDPYNPHKIFSAMEKAYKNPDIRSKYINLGKDTVKKFSWKKTAISVMEIIEKSNER